MGEKRNIKNTTTTLARVIILPLFEIKSLDENRIKTTAAKMMHIPVMVRKPKVRAVKRMGTRMFQKVKCLLRMR